MILSIIFVAIVSFCYPIYLFFNKIYLLIMCTTDSTFKLLTLLNDVYDLLKKNIRVSVYFFFSILFVGAIYLQKLINFPVYDLKSKSLFEVLGLSISILSLYGIYIGFLQYLTDHSEGNTLLGKSKVNYLIDNSIWYQITQSRSFLALLVIIVFAPAFLRLNISLPLIGIKQFELELSYMWQTALILLLVIYLFLLRMSLRIIYITLLMKTGSDSGLKEIMKKEIGRTYEKAFWKSYNTNYENRDLIKNMLSRDLKKLKEQEFDEYVRLAFVKIDEEFLLKNKEKFWKKNNIEKLSSFYIYHLQSKWSFLAETSNNLSYGTWGYLLKMDMQHINYFEEQLKRRLEIPGQNKFNKKYVTEYLFDQMFKKVNTNIQDIVKDTEYSTRNMYVGEIENLTNTGRYEIELEKYKWKQIFSNYNELQLEFELPKLKKSIRKEYSAANTDYIVAQDYSNSDLYSKTCFEFLSNYYGRITLDIKSTRYLKSLILSMNDEYLVAYSLYQLLYTDGSKWSTNFCFFDNVLEDILPKYGGIEYKYYYDFFKRVIQETYISNRITISFLENLWSTRNQNISDLDRWYESFGKRHRSSAFRLLYIQSLFTSKLNQSYVSRIDLIENETRQNNNIAISICKEYLQLLPYNSGIKEEKNLNTTVMHLLLIKGINFSEILRNLELKSLLYFEYMFRSNPISFKKLHYQNIFLESIKIDYEGREGYYFKNNEMLHFFILKMISPGYEYYFKIPDLVETIKNEAYFYLVKHDLDIPDYVEKLYRILREDNAIRISAMERSIIIDKMQQFLSNR